MDKWNLCSVLSPAIVGILLTMSSYGMANPHQHYAANVNNTFESVPTTVKTFPNDTVLLPCYHTSPPQFIRWFREDILLADSLQPELQLPPRVTLYNNGSIQVKNVVTDDTGEYVCEIMTSGGLATQGHAIEVQHAPSVVSMPSGVVEVNVGGSLSIVCEADGIPQPIITWRHQGRGRSDELDNTRMFHVEVKDRFMAGPIECIATNGVGEATAGIQLVVLFAPEIRASSSIVHSKISLRAYLECEVISSPAANVHWFHHGVPVQHDNRIGRQDSEVNFNSSVVFQYQSRTKHTLVIRKVKDSDLGIYECRAENKIGFKGAMLELTGRPMPSAFKTSPLASTPMTHNLIWQTESLSPIIEYILKFRQIPSGNITPQNRYSHIDWMELVIPSEVSDGPIHTIGYTLRGLMPASVYEVAVTSRNRYGWSDISRIIRFATGGEIEVPNYSTETIDYDQIEEELINSVNSPAPAYSDYSTGSGNMLVASICICFALLTMWMV